MDIIQLHENSRFHQQSQLQSQENQKQLNELASQMALYNRNRSLYNQVLPETVYESVDPELLSKDFGKTRFDKRAKYLTDYIDPTDLRAREQSNLGKISNALLKTGALTLTTAANFGAILTKGVWDAIKAPEGEELSAFVTNPWSQRIQEIEDNVEKALPNYRSHAEQDKEWYQKLVGTGALNFWFDDVLKNVGFTFGTGAAARLGTKALMSGVRLAERKAIRKAFQILGRTIDGPTSGKMIRNTLEELAKDAGKLPTEKIAALKKLTNINKTNDLIATVNGSILGAVGEAQFEGLTAVNENKKANIERLNAFLEQNPDYYTRMYKECRGLDDNGNPIDFETFKQQKYQNALNSIDEYSRKIGNSVFSWEVGLLTLTNASTFGRFFAHGFSNLNKTAFKTGIKEATNNVTKNIGREITSEGINAVNQLSKARRIGRIIKPVITEGPIEEMGQNFINRASENYYNSRLNEDVGFLLNDDYNSKAVDLITAIGKGFAQSYGNSDQWIDGFAGGVMGLMGIPNIRIRSRKEREKTNKKSPFEFSWNSGVYGEWKEIHDLNKLIDQSVDNVNAYLHDPEKVREFQHAVTIVANDDRMYQAQLNNDKKEYLDRQHRVLTEAVAAFQDAGMSDILDEYIESAGTDLTNEQIEEIRSVLDDHESKNATAEDIRNRIKNEAKDVKRLVKQFRDINDMIQQNYGQDLNLSEISRLSHILSLADYQFERVGKILENMPDLIDNIDVADKTLYHRNKKLNVANAAKILTKAFFMDHEYWDRVNETGEDGQSLLSEQDKNTWYQVHKEMVKSEMPDGWNEIEKENAYWKLSEAYRCLNEAKSLNNEFALYVSNPLFYRYLMRQQFEDHLDDKQKQAIDDWFKKSKDLHSNNEIEDYLQKIDNIDDADVRDKILQHLRKHGNDDIVKFLDTRYKNQRYKDIIKFNKDRIDKYEKDDDKRKDLLAIFEQFENLNYADGLKRLKELKDDNNLSQTQRELIEQLLDILEYTPPKPQPKKEDNTITPSEQIRQDTLKTMFARNSEFVKQLKEILKKRDEDITVNSKHHSVYRKIFYDGDLKLGVGISSQFDTNSRELIITYSKDDDRVTILYTIDNNSIIYPTDTFNFTDDQIKDILTTIRTESSQNSNLRSNIDNVCTKIEHLLKNTHDISSPLIQSDIDEICKNDIFKNYLDILDDPTKVIPKHIDPPKQITPDPQFHNLDITVTPAEERLLKRIIFDQLLKSAYPKELGNGDVRQAQFTAKTWFDNLNQSPLKSAIDISLGIQLLKNKQLSTQNKFHQTAFDQIRKLVYQTLLLDSFIFPQLNTEQKDAVKKIIECDEQLNQWLLHTPIHTPDKNDSTLVQRVIADGTHILNYLKTYNDLLDKFKQDLDTEFYSDRQQNISKLQETIKNIIDDLNPTSSPANGGTGFDPKSGHIVDTFHALALTQFDDEAFRTPETKHLDNITTATLASSKKNNREDKDQHLKEFYKEKKVYDFYDSGSLFTYDIFDYVNGSKENIEFVDLKQRYSDKFPNNIFNDEEVIGMYVTIPDGSKQCIGTVSFKDVNVIQTIISSGKKQNSDIFNCTANIVQFDNSHNLFVNDTNDYSLHPLRELPEIQHNESPALFFVDGEDKVHMMHSIRHRDELIESIQQKILKGEFQVDVGTIYIACQTGDAFTPNPNKNNEVDFYLRKLVSTDINTILQRPKDDRIHKKILDLIDRLSQVDLSTPADDFVALQQDLKTCFSLHDSLNSNYAYHFVLIKNSKDITLKIESTDKETGESVKLQKLNAKGELKDVKIELLRQSKLDPKSYDNIIELLKELNPICSITDETFSSDDYNQPYITYDDLIQGDLLKVPLTRLNPINIKAKIGNLHVISDNKEPRSHQVDDLSTNNHHNERQTDNLADLQDQTNELTDLQNQLLELFQCKTWDDFLNFKVDTQSIIKNYIDAKSPIRALKPKLVLMDNSWRGDKLTKLSKLWPKLTSSDTAKKIQELCKTK